MNVDLKPVRTKAASRIQNNLKDFRVLTFEEPRKSIFNYKVLTQEGGRQNFNNKDSMVNAPGGLEQQEIDIKTARRDVIKLAMNNQHIENHKKKMMTSEMTGMGFKGPQKPYKNYKVLLKERKCLKEIREHHKKFHQLGKIQAGLAVAKCTSKSRSKKGWKKRPPVTAIDQHYGTVIK